MQNLARHLVRFFTHWFEFLVVVYAGKTEFERIF